MTLGALDVVGQPKAGWLVSLEPASIDGVHGLRGAHPDPAADAVSTGQAIVAAADALGPDDLALCLVSGGGSSMLELPREGITLEALRDLTRTLRERGADIGQLNAVRRRCSAVKGGGLARRIAPAPILNVVLSDVPGHPPEVVASGPTCAPPLDAPSAEAVLAELGVRFALPEPLVGPLPAIETLVAADGSVARRAVVEHAARLGLSVADRAGVYDGDASTLGRALADDPSAEPWVWGGETTVTVRGAGRGGRNQELVLGALAQGWPGGLLMAFGTDGVDGASAAAGALLDEEVAREARERGLDPEAALADNDSATFFERAGGSLRCGPTGTNVADLLIYLPRA